MLPRSLMHNQNKVLPILAVIVLILAQLACGSDSTGKKVGETGKGSSATSAPAKLEVFQVGDVIEVGTHTIVLNSAKFYGAVLQANFTIENKGSEDLNVSSLMSFEEKDSEGSKLEQEIFDCSSGLDGKVLPGDKLKGNICWSGATTGPIKIYYSAELFSSGAVVWEVKK